MNVTKQGCQSRGAVGACVPPTHIKCMLRILLYSTIRPILSCTQLNTMNRKPRRTVQRYYTLYEP